MINQANIAVINSCCPLNVTARRTFFSVSEVYTKSSKWKHRKNGEIKFPQTEKSKYAKCSRTTVSIMKKQEEKK